MSEGTESSVPTMEPETIQTQAAQIAAPTTPPGSNLEDDAVLFSETEIPNQPPPAEDHSVSAQVQGIAAWHKGKKITALWSEQSHRNSWVYVAGLGWKKLSNANDGAIVSMTMLASVAEQTGANVNVRIESDGMVHEIYVW